MKKMCLLFSATLLVGFLLAAEIGHSEASQIGLSRGETTVLGTLGSEPPVTDASEDNFDSEREPESLQEERIYTQVDRHASISLPRLSEKPFRLWLVGILLVGLSSVLYLRSWRNQAEKKTK